jgi:hypothetical protein
VWYRRVAARWGGGNEAVRAIVAEAQDGLKRTSGGR